MINLYFEKSKNSERQKLGKYRTEGEAATAAVDYILKNRLPMDVMRHYKEQNYNVYDLGTWGRILVVKE